ncbi:MAG: hypothetical protein JWO59_3018 [Chloroflexi bacterium]|nr:hypothetical protein [Chloroflexota bacterium]
MGHAEGALDDVSFIANDIAKWLTSKAGVRDVHAPLITPRSVTRGRFPFPKPPFRPKALAPSFEIRFMFKNEHRLFRYFLEHVDDLETIENTLHVHTNGELMIRIPNAFGHLMPNDIYYGNRSASASTLGKVAPRA